MNLQGAQHNDNRNMSIKGSIDRNRVPNKNQLSLIMDVCEIFLSGATFCRCCGIQRLSPYLRNGISRKQFFFPFCCRCWLIFVIDRRSGFPRAWESMGRWRSFVYINCHKFYFTLLLSQRQSSRRWTVTILFHDEELFSNIPLK